MIRIRLWTLYWRVRYGIGARVTGGTMLHSEVIITWTEPATGARAVNVMHGPPALVLKNLPAMTRLIDRNHRNWKAAQ